MCLRGAYINVIIQLQNLIIFFICYILKFMWGPGRHINPLFWHKSYTQWPHFSLQSTPNDPFFSKFKCEISNFSCASHAFQNFGNFQLKWQIFTEFLQNLHWITSNFGKFTPKKAPIFFYPSPNVPPLSTKSYTKCPLFLFSGRYKMSFSYSSDSPGVWTLY